MQTELPFVLTLHLRWRGSSKTPLCSLYLRLCRHLNPSSLHGGVSPFPGTAQTIPVLLVTSPRAAMCSHILNIALGSLREPYWNKELAKNES